MKEIKIKNLFNLLPILFKEKNVVIFVEKENILRWYIKNIVPNECIFLYLSYINNTLLIEWDNSVSVNDFKKIYIAK